MKFIQAGMTWIEVTIGLCIMALILSFSIPMLSDRYTRLCLDQMLVNLEQGVEYARLQAVIQHKTLQITPLDNQIDFSLGMRIVSGSEIIKIWHWSAAHSQVTWHGFQSARGVLFSADIHHLASNGYFLIQTPDHKIIKLVVNRMGNTRRVI